MTSAALTLRSVIDELATRLAPGMPEVHVLVSPDGRILSRLTGNSDMVMTGGIPARLLHGAFTVHQHPGPLAWPPSENDIVNALAVGERAMFVVGRDGIHRWATRQPARRSAAAPRFSALLDAAELLDARTARRVGWYGTGRGVAPAVLRRMPAAMRIELVALAAAYPEFVSYQILPPRTPAARLLAGL